MEQQEWMPTLSGLAEELNKAKEKLDALDAQSPDVKSLADVTEKIDKQDLEKIKAEKFEAFKILYAARIKTLPIVHGQKKVPCVWNEKAQDWVWISREFRRRAERTLRKAR